MTTIGKLETKKATRPASRWRNRWLVHEHFIGQSGRHYYPGEQWGIREWPSRDIAETEGRRIEAEGPDVAKYLGAFPVDAS